MKLVKKYEAPIWVLFLSAISLVIGLATYGYDA
jgi:phosphate/sulfate permease